MSALKNTIERDGAKILGKLVWWGTFKASVTPHQLLALAHKHGLDDSLLPQEPTPERAFRRAATHASSDERGVRVEHVFSDACEITYAVLEKVTDKASRRAGYRQVARATWFPTLQRFQTDDPENDAIQDIQAKLPEYSQNYVTDDITVLANNVMREAQAIRMVGTGGNSRFVPVEYADTVDALVGVLSEIEGCQIETINVPDDDESRGTMVRAARSSFADMIEEMEREAQRLEAALEAAAEDGTSGPRQSTFARRIDDIRDIQAKLDLFADTLRFKADDLVARIEQTEATFSRMLGR